MGSNKERLLKKIEELERERRARKEVAKQDRPYSGWWMNSDRMPLGCWLWVIGLVTLAVLLVKSISKP